MTYTPRSFYAYVETNLSKKDLEAYTGNKELFGAPIPYIENISPFYSSTTGSYQYISNPNEFPQFSAGFGGGGYASYSGIKFYRVYAGIYEIDYNVVFKVSTSVSGSPVDRFLNPMDDSSAYPALGDNTGAFWNRSQTIFSGVSVSSSNTFFSKSKYLSSPMSKTAGTVESNRVLVNFSVKGQIEYTADSYTKIDNSAFNTYHGFASMESYFCRLTKLT